MTLRKLVFSFIIWSFVYAASISAQTEYYGGEMGKKFDYFLYYLNNYYIDSTDNNYLTDLAIRKAMSVLDPYSVYQTKEELEAQLKSDSGFNGKGTGFSFYKFQRNRAIINYISPNGPADKLGIEKGDELIEVDNQKINNLSKFEINTLLTSMKDTLNIRIKAFGSTEKELTIIKQYLPYKSIVSYYKLKDDIAYIKLTSFNSNTETEFIDAIESLKSQGVKHLIFDLRGNRGGVKDQAVLLADHFLSKDKLIVYSKGVHHLRQDDISTEKGLFEKGKVIVLCDGSTASASEILLGALQDWDRALVMGEESFGKGLIQQSYKLDDGSAVRLTIAKYYTPLGRVIQKIEPTRWSDTLGEKNKVSIETKNWNVADKYFSFSNSQRKFLTGIGGVIPDIYCVSQQDKTLSEWSYYKDGLMYDFAFEYSYIQRNILLNRYNSASELKEDLSLDPQISSEFENYLRIKNFSQDQISKAIFPKSGLIKTKAWICALLWDDKEYYEMDNINDALILKAVEKIKSTHYNRTF